MSWNDVAQALLACACEALAAQDPPWTGECCVTVNQPEYDSCDGGDCAGGQLWVRYLRTYPSTNLPAEDPSADLTKCGTRWALLFEVGVVRCVCWDMCDCEQKNTNSQLVIDDAEALLKGLVCCFAEGTCVGLDGRVISQDSIPMETGCAGSKVTVAIGTGTCCD
jgi:hypothetical protein